MWEAVLDRLGPSGSSAQTIDLPSVAAEDQPRFGMRDDAKVVRGLLSRTQRPLVVVAHSYGAIPVTQVAHELPHIRHIVYVAAFQLDVGETLLGAVGGHIPSWWAVNGDTVAADRPTDVFYNDVEPRVAARAQNRLLPTTFAAFTEPLTAAAWRNIPSTYITCERDQALPLHAQEAMAQRAENVQRLSAGHSPMLSCPSELAEIINGVAAQN